MLVLSVVLTPACKTDHFSCQSSPDWSTYPTWRVSPCGKPLGISLVDSPIGSTTRELTEFLPQAWCAALGTHDLEECGLRHGHRLCHWCSHRGNGLRRRLHLGGNHVASAAFHLSSVQMATFYMQFVGLFIYILFFKTKYTHGHGQIYIICVCVCVPVCL